MNEMDRINMENMTHAMISLSHELREFNSKVTEACSQKDSLGMDRIIQVMYRISNQLDSMNGIIMENTRAQQELTSSVNRLIYSGMR